MLQTRVGKRTAAAAFVIASPAGRRGRDRPRRGALAGHRRSAASADVPDLRPVRFADRGRPRDRRLAGRRRRQGGLRRPPGRRPWPRRGEKVILVRRETNPDDLPGMIAAQAILTSRGGKTSHAAVVARGMGKTCVCGADAIEVDVRRAPVHGGRARRGRGRRHLHRRHHRHGVPR